MVDHALAGFILVVALALVFDFINGFHDTANAIATSVATRVLSPGRAVLMAAAMNFLGALSGTAVATTVGRGIIPPEAATQTLVVGALLSAITWDLITWYYGLPSSSSHALVFSIVGAGVAIGGWGAILADGVTKTFQGLGLSPVLGFLGATVILMLLRWLFATSRPTLVSAIFGRAQVGSAVYMAFSHGSNDAQKTMGVMTMALAAYGGWSGSQWQVPLWIIISAATAMALGTAVGGWRIIRTMGLRITHIRPIHGFAAETAAATVIEVASRLGIPVSTTHTISSAILGVGSVQRLSAVRWGVAGNIVVAWVLTIPACTALGWVYTTLLRLVVSGA
ncbi:MAG: inorganic phosphate transporter [Chloroflexi bacterium]|nr:inorganic phosphate transporter [Chloroflexota bacterium]